MVGETISRDKIAGKTKQRAHEMVRPADPTVSAEVCIGATSNMLTVSRSAVCFMNSSMLATSSTDKRERKQL
jgi:hypothetical protein